MNPECPCCDREMKEIEIPIDTDERGETEVVGYECEPCGIQVDLNGEEI